MIVGDDTVVKVHIHVLNPGLVLDYAVGLGELGQIKIDNMQAQTRTLTAQRESRSANRLAALLPVESIGNQSVVAVAAGDGLATVLRSMGASGVLLGGQSMNPSIEEILAYVNAAPSDDVILLPNNPNIILTANQVPELTAKRVRVVPSRSIPQGLAALAAFNADADLDANAASMTAALVSVRTVEVTRAVRDATINGVVVRSGQVIGLVDDVLVAADDCDEPVCVAAMALAGAADAELVTVFVGEETDPNQTATLREALAVAYPSLQIEVYDGGQPHYRFIIAVE